MAQLKDQQDFRPPLLYRHRSNAQGRTAMRTSLMAGAGSTATPRSLLLPNGFARSWWKRH